MKRLEPVACPFCERHAARPKKIEVGVITSEGGRCECGAIFIADPTGREGGQCLLDGLALLCDGDLNAATGLTEGEDVEVIDLCYDARTYSLTSKRRGPRAFGQSKLWFIRLTSPTVAPSA